jgi:CheY-like chemotaxis protein
MPEMDGIETTGKLRELGYTAPIVALTANAVTGQADVFLKNGFDEFISKPIDIHQLNSVLVKLVQSKQPPEVIEAAKQQKPEANVVKAEPKIDPMLLESFIRDARKAVVWLEENVNMWIDNQDILRKFTIIVHGIKSSLWSVNEHALSDKAFKLEQAGRDNDLNYLKAFAKSFMVDLRALLEQLEAMQNAKNQISSGTDVNAEELREKLLAIMEMCADYNRKGALDIITGIKNTAEETKVILESIMEHVLHSEFEDAESAAADYADKLSHGASK